MMRFKLDATVFKMRVKRVIANSPEARKVAVYVIGGEFVGLLMIYAPQDTTRYVRAWVQAGNEAGVTAIAIPPIRPSKYIMEIRRRLRRRISFWAYVVRANERKGRDDRHTRKAKRTLERLTAQLEGLTESAIMIGLRGMDRGREVRAISRVYGGTGTYIAVGDRTYLELRNLEPHARLVEHKFGTMSKAFAGLRGFGLHRASDAYVRKVALVGEWAAAPGSTFK